MSDQVSENGDDHFSLATKVQLSGVLAKKPFGHQSSKWSKRFFVVKDGFLLYYPEGEKKMFDKRGSFNIHPKGVIPLGGSNVSVTSDATHHYVIQITSDEYTSGYIALAAETKMELDKWVSVLQEASRITWKNTQLGETIIRQLETLGLELTKEKQTYVDKLKLETIALRDEMEKNEELERLTADLEKEKKRLEELVTQLQEEHNKTRREYEETAETLNLLENEKMQLKQTTDMLQTTLQDLEKERQAALELLQNKEQENQNLYVTTEELHSTLKDIEDQTRFLLREKMELEQRYMENQIQAQILEEERQIFSEQANQLWLSLNELLTQKEIKEAELKEEIVARSSAEKKLKAAEESLRRLESAFRSSTAGINEPLKEELLPDVKNLKRFFEDIAEGTKAAGNKPQLLTRTNVMAHKSHVQRAQTLRLKSKRREVAKTLAVGGGSEEGGGGSGDSSAGALRRTQSMLLVDSTQSKLHTLRRTMSSRISRITKAEASDGAKGGGASAGLSMVSE